MIYASSQLAAQGTNRTSWYVTTEGLRLRLSQSLRAVAESPSRLTSKLGNLGRQAANCRLEH